MITSQYVNTDFILEKVKNDLPPSVEINESDVVELIWEALSKIGALPTYITLYSLLEVKQYKAKLPDWLHVINEVRYLNIDDLDDITEENLNDILCKSFKMATVIDTFDISSNTNNIGDSQGYRYIVKNGYIHTTFEEGVVELSYEAMPIDNDGRPLIPKDVYFIEAVKYYILKSYTFRLMMRDTTYSSIYQLVDAEWKFYVNSASNKAKIPNRDGMQALMNKFLRIVPMLDRNIKYTYHRLPTLNKNELNNIIS